MKRILIVLMIMGVAIMFAGCTTSKTNTDNADSAMIDSNAETSGIITPPTPPTPTR